jgi:hypothetical protein
MSLLQILMSVAVVVVQVQLALMPLALTTASQVAQALQPQLLVRQ